MCIRDRSDRSEIIDFYPSDFAVDTKGKRYEWMGEVLLPFIEEERLLTNIQKHISGLNEEEEHRNTEGHVYIFTHKETVFYTSFISSLKGDNACLDPKTEIKLEWGKNQLAGTLHGNPESRRIGQRLQRPFVQAVLETVEYNNVVSFIYESPPYRHHETSLLPGVELPPYELNDYVFEHLDRKFYAGSRAIKLLEKVLGVNLQPQSSDDRGDLVFSINERVSRRESVPEEKAPEKLTVKRNRSQFEGRQEDEGDKNSNRKRKNLENNES
eukprot:TRINITY_DN11976_c0_g1_i2.p1 TRINITY_DN11976_c0_g1~~TRINITY_DN11976_c0_g1_i2.p1  ORF type:complete len:285 (-),score=59.02 TRINITY_DN11976_c0_g1_i2:158-964(-)